MDFKYTLATVVLVASQGITPCRSAKCTSRVICRFRPRYAKPGDCACLLVLTHTGFGFLWEITSGAVSVFGWCSSCVSSRWLLAHFLLDCGPRILRSILGPFHTNSTMSRIWQSRVRCLRRMRSMRNCTVWEMIHGYVSVHSALLGPTAETCTCVGLRCRSGGDSRLWVRTAENWNDYTGGVTSNRISGCQWISCLLLL